MVMLYRNPCYNEACYNEFELYLQNERLKHLVQEAEEKAESSELQINSISREYRTLLEGKEVNMTRQQLVRFSSVYEPHCEKTCLWGFRPGSTQTGLCSRRR